MSNREVVQSNDGSNTMYNSDVHAYYHSIHGALTESQHVFIKYGIEFCKPKENKLVVFEMGYGTGLNAMLTFLYAQQHHIQVRYIACETHPITKEELAQLELKNILSLDDQTIEQFHPNECNEEIKISDYFQLKLIPKAIESLDLEPEFVNCIYYDAFAPSVQPELWTKSIFEQLHSWLVPNGHVITYCAKGQVKRDFRSSGFEVEALPGPPGKREITRAIKINP